MRRTLMGGLALVVCASGFACARPDLVVPSSVPYLGGNTSPCKPGGALGLTVDVTLLNQGNGVATLPSGKHWVGVYSSYGGPPASFSDAGPSQLKPGESVHLQVRALIKVERIGDLEIFSWWVMADPDKAVLEQVETNNLDKGPEFKNTGPNYFCS